MKCLNKLLVSMILYVNLHKVIAAPGSSRPKEGDMRLQSANGFRAAEAGNVLVYHDGRWGAVCDDGWTLYNAEVVCKMLGYPNAIGHTKEAYFGIPKEEFWLDNVQCFGDEENLLDCKHLGWGEHDCVLREAAGVFCSPKPKQDSTTVTTSSIPSTTPPLAEVVTSRKRDTATTQQPYNVVHLVQQPEVPNSGQEARAVSEHGSQNIGSFAANTNPPPLNEVQSTTQAHAESSRRPTRINRPQHRHNAVNRDHIETNEVQPSPHSEHHHDHRHHQDAAVPQSPTASASRIEALPPTVNPFPDEADMLQNDAVVDAVLTMEDKVNAVEEEKLKALKYDIHNPPHYKIRLEGGRNYHEGRVRVHLGEQWGTICSDGWDLREANVACRQLGLNYASNAYGSIVFGGEEEDKLVAGLECDGHETRLSDCFHRQIGKVLCPSMHLIAGVICTNALPDLVPNATLLEYSTYLQDRQMYYLQCAMEEGCASSSAYAIQKANPNWYTYTRRLLRFSSSTWNFGTADFRPFLRKEDWEWHLCHMHYHSMEVFAQYDLLDKHGNRVAEGHKASFCLEDVQCLPGRQKRYRCEGFGEQGISVGCADDYLHDIDCQWIDISDVSPGDYIFQVHVNPTYYVAEINFDNNLAQCDLSYTGNSVVVRNCVIVNDGLK